FVAADVQLPLWRDRIEATSAASTFHRYHGQAIARIRSDTVIGAQQTLFDVAGGLVTLLLQLLLFLLGIGNDGVEFLLLHIKVLLALLQQLAALIHNGFLVVDDGLCLLDALLG